MFKVVLNLNLLICLILGLAQCSLSGIPVGNGSTTSPNDSRPSGVLIAQGSFTGQNGQNASGSAQIFMDGGAYILRLEGISVPSENGLNVQVLSSASQTPVYSSSLRSSSGNQNYSFSTALTGRFATVYIYSTLRQKNYGIAILSGQ